MKKIISTLLTLSLFLSATPVPAVLAEQSQADSIEEALTAAPYRENELLVKISSPLAQSYSLNESAPTAKIMPETVETLFYPNSGGLLRSRSIDASCWKLYRYPEGTDLKAAMGELEQNPSVSAVTPNYIIPQPASNVTPPPADASANQWYLQRIGLPQAKEFLELENIDPQGRSDVVVATIDTGVDVTHPAIKNALWTNPKEIDGNGKDDDGNGYIDDIHGYNFCDNNTDLSDINEVGHGTGTASLIVAQNTDGKMQGVAPHVKLMPLKIFGGSACDVSLMIKAIKYAADNGADIINISLSIALAAGDTATPNEKLKPLKDMIDSVYSSSIVVAAAGNDALDNGRPNELLDTDKNAWHIYPAAYDNVVGVMSEDQAINAKGYLSAFSMWDVTPGNRIEYEVMAPGSSIYTAGIRGGYQTVNGTSYSAPLVSGIFALLRSMYPDKSAVPNHVLISQFLDSCNYKLGTTYKKANGVDARLNYRSADAFRALTGGKPYVHPVSYQLIDNQYFIRQAVSNPDTTPLRSQLLISAFDSDSTFQKAFCSTQQEASEYGNTTFTCAVPTSYASLRAMLWGSLNGLDPLTEAATIPAPVEK